ncbi:MAG: class I SAM-dependent methyltransferase [Clostridia bacterium]|nr:class I SAM-dependent methyltransferase [Clostridia bacterium]
MDLYFGMARRLLDNGLATAVDSYGNDNLYDRTIQFTDDLAFYRDLAKKQGGPVLDIACGTGRVLLHLLGSGYTVVGLDLSAPMLEMSREKARTLGFEPVLHQGDMREFDLEGRRFSLIIIP